MILIHGKMRKMISPAIFLHGSKALEQADLMQFFNRWRNHLTGVSIAGEVAFLPFQGVLCWQSPPWVGWARRSGLQRSPLPPSPKRACRGAVHGVLLSAGGSVMRPEIGISCCSHGFIVVVQQQGSRWPAPSPARQAGMSRGMAGLGSNNQPCVKNTSRAILSCRLYYELIISFPTRCTRRTARSPILWARARATIRIR